LFPKRNGGANLMSPDFTKPKPSGSSVLGVALAVFALLALLTPHPATAITAELAKKCDAMVATAFPPRQLGNPAAGSAKGNSKAQRDYYRQCVAKDGKMDDAPAK
jgi:hypothetical protein